MPYDSKGQLYVEFQNIRVTFVPSAKRLRARNWAGADVLRIQARQSGKNRALHRGAEVPIRCAQEFGELVGALAQAYVGGAPRPVSESR